MEANDFISRLKADTVEKYRCDLCKVFEEYKLISGKLPVKDRGLFGLNVLRTLCWNLEKAPIWRDSINNTSLLQLTIDCIRETRQMGGEDLVKTLSCIYHMHKYAIKLNTSVAPELVLKISVMPFELDSKYLLKEYYKTYWHLLADRLMYIERLKTKVNITKLLPKVTADIIKIMEIYDTVLFCSSVIVFVFKKLHMLYSDTDANKLVQPFKQIFSTLSKKNDVAKLKELPDQEILDIYTKLNDCLFVVADNSSKMHFKDGILIEVARICAALVSHRPDLIYCLQTFYVTSFCEIISSTDMLYVEAVFSSLEATCLENKLDYDQALSVTYPYVTQLLRLYLEYAVAKVIKLTKKIQENCLKLMLFFTKNLKHSNQIMRCDNCSIKTGLHDAFRLILLSKHLAHDDILDLFYTVTTEQYILLAKFKEIGCANYQKYFRKVQTDVHNTAISLNKSQHYVISIKLFDIYLKHELKCTQNEHKNVARALFNKSICELDSELYEKALINAFLSLTFAKQEGLQTNKYMSLVMDIKAKELKSKADGDDGSDQLQLVTVLDACKMALDRKLYGDLMPFLKEVQFSALLRHEWSQYAGAWPSAAPLAGVWRALHHLARGAAPDGLPDEAEAAIQVLYDVILETPSVVRTIHNTYFSTIVEELLEDFDNMSTLSADEKLVHAGLLFLQCEYDLAAASEQYGWKITELGGDPERGAARRTVPAEHAAAARAILALRLLRHLSPALTRVSRGRLRSALQIFQIFVPLLQQLSRDVQALQLAHYCCLIADILEDRESYLRNAGVLLTSPGVVVTSPGVTRRVLERAVTWRREGWGEGELVFLCDVAMYYSAQGKPGAAARLVRAARATMSLTQQSQPDLDLDLALGRLLEAQNLLYEGPDGASTLTALNAALKHYLGVTGTGGAWSARRLRSQCARRRAVSCGERACRVVSACALRPRARACAASVLSAACAPARAALAAHTTDVAATHAAQIKIDQHLKEILGLKPSKDTHLLSTSDTQKQPIFTPKQELETMRDNMMLRNQSSPSDIVCSVPAFRIPDFIHHHIKCACYACEIPTCVILSCKTSSLEAATYAFANETEIARNYYQGVLNMIEIAEKKLKKLKKVYMESYDEFIVVPVFDKYDLEFKTMVVQFLIDAAFFELKNGDFDATEERLVEINGIVQEFHVDRYLMNDVSNLMAAFAQLKKGSKKPHVALEEFENLHPSPVRGDVEPPKTPESKPIKPLKPITKVVVKKEELPQKPKVKGLHLSSDDEDDFEKPKPLTRGAKRDKFKIPNPTIPNPALELATPIPSRSKPLILVTTPSVELATPNNRPNDSEFFTPQEPTPEQFFTAKSTKTYSKRLLSQNIVKKLENELLTPGPSAAKENTHDNSIKSVSTRRMLLKKEITATDVKTGKERSEKATGKEEKPGAVKESMNKRGTRNEKDKKGLMRAVSPGKMDKEHGKTSRSRRQV